MLEFRKTETGKLKLVAIKGNIIEHIEENCIAFKGLAIKKNINLSFSSTDANIEAWFDREKLEMIINNLLSNAIKSTSENENITVSVFKNIKAEQNFPEGKIIVQITDEGTGIPADQLDKIFDRFYQVRGAHPGGGTGIGLALTKRLIELHKGLILVESQLGKGTKFSVYLPLGKSHLTEDDIVLDTDNFSSKATLELEEEDIETINTTLEKIASLSDQKKKILIIEDNAEIRTYLKDLLKERFIIEEAENGADGLKIARKIHPAIIVSDVMMPAMDGVELCKIIKSEFQTSHIPIILITANLTHNVHINSLEVGADAYLTKPFKPDVLITRIYNLLKSRENLRDYYIKKFQGNFISDENSLSKDEEFLMKVNQILQKNMSNSDFSIAILHEELGLSRTVFYNKIKSLTNLSPIDLIRQIRLKKAGDLLQTGNFKVYEAMFQVGFCDEKHFRQLFKKQFGVTPSEYIKSE